MILSAQGICKSFGSRQVLKSVDLRCSRGEICGLIGPNGAGKSTLFRIILGLVRKDSGSVQIKSYSDKPVGGIIDKPALYGYLSAFNNLKVFAGLQGISLNHEMYKRLMHQVNLEHKRHDQVSHYSMGMKQRLGLAIVLINRPDCILLDEPFSGLDPMGIRSLHQLIRNLSEEGIAVIISSHNLLELEDLCDYLYVMNQGRITTKGPTMKVLRNATSTYLIYGSNLRDSKRLHEFGAVFKGDSALVRTRSEGIEVLLKHLIEEGIFISACIPQTDLEVLFNTKDG